MYKEEKNKRLKRLKIDFMKITELKEIRWGYLMDNLCNVYSEKYGYLNRIEPHFNKQQRWRVLLVDESGKPHNILLHILIAEAFVKNDDPANKTEVHHKDGNKWNNDPKNLEWVTPEDHDKKDTVRRSGKLVVQKDLDGNVIKRFSSSGEARKYYGWNEKTLIDKCLKGKADTAYGCVWEYEPILI